MKLWFDAAGPWQRDGGGLLTAFKHKYEYEYEYENKNNINIISYMNLM